MLSPNGNLHLKIVTFSLHIHLSGTTIGLLVGNDVVAFILQIKLADKQAALEKLEWEAKMSNRKVEELQDESVSMDLEITALMQIFEELSKNSSATHPDEKITSFHYFEQSPPIVSSSFLFPCKIKLISVIGYIIK